MLSNLSSLRTAYVLLFALIITSSAYAQQRVGNFIAYGRESGLQSSLNYSVFQSSDGYLWIGTASGLMRFDGKRYKNFFSRYIDPNSPSDNFITEFEEDKNKNLWICGYLNGLTKYDPRTGNFRQYPGYGIFAIHKDKKEDLWVGTAGRGLARYNYAKDSFDLFDPDPSADKNYVTDLTSDKKHSETLWLSTYDGFYSFNKQYGNFKKIQTALIENVPLLSIETDKQSCVWLGSRGRGIFCFDINKQVLTQIKPADFTAFDIKAVNDSIMYIAAGNKGILSLNTKTKKIVSLSQEQGFNWPVTNPDIQKISVTKSAGIFAGGYSYIYQLHPSFLRFSATVHFNKNADEAGDIYLNQALFDAQRNVYWMACYNVKGLYRISADFNKQEIIPALETMIDEKSFSNVCITATNQVLAVGETSGLWFFDKSAQHFRLAKNLFPGSDTLYSKIIRIEADSKGNCWMFAGDRMLYWDTKNKTISSLPLTRNTSFRNTAGISNVKLKIDKKNRAWLATNIGLFVCDQVQKKVAHIIPAGKTEADIANLFVKAITIDKYGYAWLGYTTEGLQVVDPETKKIVSVHDLDGGLPSMQVNYMATDTAGRIWAATDPGLAMFDPVMKQWQLFNRYDGINRDYLDRPIIACSNGIMIIDQVNGFSWFDCTKFRASDQIPVIHITSLKIDGTPYKSDVLPDYEEKLELPWRTNDINIEFSAMDWLYPGRTRYYYLVEGIHDPTGWIRISEGSINLPGMKPGHYTLKIKALNSNGAWLDVRYQKHLRIVVKPPFWQQWWFIGICVLLLVALFYAIYRYRVGQLMRLQEVRNNISQNLHDDIGASLSNISILNELTKRNIENKEKAVSYLSKASDDIQRISESLSDIVWNINPRYDDLSNLFIRMKRYAADMMEGKQINCQLIFPEENESISLPMDKRRDFYMIFKEAVNNLAKYSKATQARVEVRFHDCILEMIIEDNGKGFDINQTGFGNGLQNMQQRADKLEAKLSVKSTPGKGTLVVLVWPL